MEGMAGYGLLVSWAADAGLPFVPWLLLLGVLLALGYVGAPLLVWTAALLGWGYAQGLPLAALGVAAAGLLFLNVLPLRRALFSAPVMRFLRRANILPAISKTEKIALEAGSTWVDAELFSGNPDFASILREGYPSLSAEEQEFVDKQVETLCAMTQDWEIFKNGDLSPEIWEYVKRERFFGLIIPKEYGGRGFSALGHSQVVSKIASRSIPLSITVMVPNSLGPAELLVHYGTDQQKNYYLPRLARGEEIPCFALTEPNAGSDAGSIQAEGVVFKGEDGKLYLRLNWNKRYITLAAISTIIGLAFRLRDPENLLGRGEDVGITCALIPSNTKGVVLGQRHNPMGIPFFNCPTRGQNVVVSADQIIGGVQGAGRGWQMLMESLAAGRSISLPAQSAGGAKMTARYVSAYSVVRKQFGLPIHKFEGIEEQLAKIGAYTYMLEATRIFTAGAVDAGIKPAVVSAIAKCYATELCRQVVTWGMDVVGGAGISRGPRNLLANGYIASPIAITVEGANILTRTMIIFGQGAIRCHPYAYKELKALMEKNVPDFDRAFFSHIGFVVRNFCRALVMSLTRGRVARSPVSGPTARYYQKLSWASASFAFLADVAMGTLGGNLKMKEKLTGRFADILAWMYLGTATLRRFEADGRKADHLPFVHWVLQHAFAQMQAAFDGIYANMSVPVVGWILRGPIAAWSHLNHLGNLPHDDLGHEVARLMTQPGDVRQDLTQGTYTSSKPDDPMGRFESAFRVCAGAEEVFLAIRKAVKEKRLPKLRPELLVDEAVAAGVITAEQARYVKLASEAREDAIQVDAYKVGEYQSALMDRLKVASSG